MTVLAPHPYCCGAQILNNFAFQYGDQYAAREEPQIKALIDNARYATTGMYADRKPSIITAILNGEQITLGRPVLERLGFRLVTEARNPVHNNGTTIYLFVLNIGTEGVVWHDTAKGSTNG